MRSLFISAVFLALCVVGVPAYAEELGPGDYGYRHMEYHMRGTVDEVEEKSGKTCCDNVGECRATYVNLLNRTAYLNGKWCPIKADAAIRYDVSLPDEMAMVCAGAYISPKTGCPTVYCGAVPSGT